ncbi:hypothetical protein UIS43_27330 [Nocardiopsis sp. LDBS0036]
MAYRVVASNAEHALVTTNPAELAAHAPPDSPAGLGWLEDEDGEDLL